MPRGYRLAVVAALGWLILAAAQQPAKEHKGAHPAPQTQPSPPTFTAYPNPYTDACYHAKDHDAAELCAEWRSAVSGEKSAREAARATTWSIVATLLSFVGVGGLIYTIWQTQGSLREARRGNRISMKANARASRQAIASASFTAAALAIAERNAQSAERQIELS